MNERLYLMGTYESCIRYAREKNLKKHEWVHIRSDGEQVRGTRNPKIVELYYPAGYYQPGVLAMIRSRGF